MPNERWSMDFISDSLHDGRRFRALTLVDHFTRESPAIEVGNSIPGKRVVDEWAHRNGVKLDFFRPGKPIENA